MPFAAFAASMYSFAVLYGFSALTQSTNSSSASIATGVRSFQLNGMPVASGVVNRFDSVMMILCGLPRELFTSRKPSPPAPPALLITHHRLLHQIVLGDDALDGARHLIGAAAGAGRNDEFDRTGRLPRGRAGVALASAAARARRLVQKSQCP